MIPYYRFLLALMLAPMKQVERIDYLNTHNCVGISIEALNDLAKQLAKTEGLDDDLRVHFEMASLNKLNPSYSFRSLMSFAMKYEIIDTVKAIIEPGDDDSSLAIKLMAKRKYYRIMGPLLLSGEEPTTISTIFLNRFNSPISNDVVSKAMELFFQFGSMSEDEIDVWIDHHKSRERHALRLALLDHPYRVRDYLGVSAGLDLEYISERIMSRSFAKFEDLSDVNHFKAAEQAMKWGRLALQAGRENENTKGGDFGDFLALFQVSLQEADANIVRIHNAVEDDE